MPIEATVENGAFTLKQLQAEWREMCGLELGPDGRPCDRRKFHVLTLDHCADALQPHIEAEAERAKDAELMAAKEMVRHEAACHSDCLRELEKLEAENERLKASHAELVTCLEIIAGKRQCVDNLMGDKDIARAALARAEALKEQQT